jgi:hypothetical protein
LLDIACRDTGQSRLMADFLLVWHNAEANGAWDPTDRWDVDAAIADDMLTVLRRIRMLGEPVAWAVKVHGRSGRNRQGTGRLPMREGKPITL